MTTDTTVDKALADHGLALGTEVALTLRHGGKVTGVVVDARIRLTPVPFGPNANVELLTVTIRRHGAGVPSDRARVVVPWHAIDLIEPTTDGSSTHPAL